MTPDQGVPGWFIAVFILFLMVGIGTTIWRVPVARKMAEDAGLDPNKATAVTLLSQDGVDAAYLASTLAARSQHQTPPATQPPPKNAEERLRELQALKDQGLVTSDEYEAQRQKILGSI